MTDTTSTRFPAAAQQTTRAAVIDAFGGPELLHMSAIPLSAPSASQVQLKVAAIAVNAVDLQTRSGRAIPVAEARFPMVLGWDVAGTVVAVGADVTGWQVGDRAAAMVFQPKDQHGTYAERINLDAGLLSRVPDELSLEQAATVPLAGLTAAQLLDLAHIGDVRTLLVNAPLGAVGRGVLALAVAAGVEVIAVARAQQTDQLRDFGAALAVERGDYTAHVRQHYPNGVDAAIDLVGGAAAHMAFNLVRDGGRYITSVPPYIDPGGPFDAARGIPVQLLVVAPNPAQLTKLLGQAASGALDATIEQTYPLDQATDAHQHRAAGKLTGRIVLIP